MNKRLLIAIASALLATACVVSAIVIFKSSKKNDKTGETAKVSAGVDFLFEEYEGYGNSAPVIKEADGKRYLFYTTNEEAQNKNTSIAVRVGEQKDGVWKYGEQKIILRSVEGGWDSYNLSSADVVEGTFSYQGTKYSKLMVYQANNLEAEKRFQIGLAVSDSYEEGWVRVGEAPFITYDYEGYGDTYGVGNPSVFNVNDEGRVMIFYGYGSTTVSCTRFVEADLSDLSKPVTSGAITVGSDALPLDGYEVAMIANADFKYDAAKEMVYMVKDGYPYATNAPQTATKVEVAKIPVRDLFKAKATWTNVVSTIDSLELNGAPRVYAACLVSDGLGHIQDVADLELGFTSNIAATSETDKKYEYYESLHCFAIPSTLREDAE